MSKLNFEKMGDNERYAFLIESAVKNREIWLLKATEGMYAMLEDDNGNQYIPVWPEMKAAADYANDGWEDYTTDRMGIGEYLEWMNELDEDKILVAAFPITGKPIIPINPKVIKEHISNEMNAD
ncbi:MAG: hypothetical protein A2W91_20510 [Bacteroidetes bacterium GWF2_38_335]|nr:MAG: hypothetical protein A2W91_20510 [Bacteroidetes bacterium GWF2_38_335]OFY79461.1 MAG: hypothetical protein A2281_13575 [Bacteroidetes bacterium RIFOXYA12_FULL_38_20]HBS86603.1 hypothetical protein [Bacteroidales bacterium]